MKLIRLTFGVELVAFLVFVLLTLLAGEPTAGLAQVPGQMQQGMQAQQLERTGEVVSGDGRPVAAALVTVRSGAGTPVREVETDESGRFRLTGIPIGSYQLTIAHPDFESRMVALSITSLGNDRAANGTEKTLVIQLGLRVLRDAVTVTTSRGGVDDVGPSPYLVSVRDRTSLDARPLPTIGQALEGSPGILLQQSTSGQISPFLRGLTGYQVLNLIDGIRLNNSTFRSGPNQYLGLIEPSQVQRLEAMLGPSGSQYGSDGLGGVIHLQTEAPRFRSPNEVRPIGEVRLFGASADLSSGIEGKMSGGRRGLAWVGGLNGRWHQDLRPGQGIDSRHVFRRFLDLPAARIRDLTGNRLEDTGFRSFGWHTRLTLRLPADQFLNFRYQYSDLGGVRAYKDLWGGLGRLRSSFEPQSLNFLYARYEKLGWGRFDSLTATFSLNSQRDGSIRQGLRTTDRITTDLNRVDSYGYIGQATTRLGTRQLLTFGGELYDDRIVARRDEADPITAQVVTKRALYPNGSRYRTGGVFGQDSFDIVRRPDRSVLRATFGLRYTGIGFQTFAARNRDLAGRNLGVVDSALNFQDLTWHTSLSWQVTGSWGLHLLAGRGFRAPNLNDLGALGLNDLGYEVPAEAAAAAGALVGASDGEGVATSGRPVAPLRAERLVNYEIGTTWRLSRLSARAQLFYSTLEDPIVRRTLLFPVDRVPSSLAGIAVVPIAQTPQQQSQRVTGVATALDPRAVKSFINEGRSLYYGAESGIRLTLTSWLALDGQYSFLVGRELNPNRFIRRLPPQQGTVSLQFQPSGRLLVELSGNFSGSQNRLSGGDLTDERIGAARRRRDIVDFLQGAIVRPFLAPGLDGLFGTPDDLFNPTGETVAAIRDRVVPIGATINGVKIVDDSSRVPLYTSTSGFAVFNLQGSYRLGENVTINFALRNILDRNYRFHGSGIDEPGINAFLGVKFSF